MATASIGRMSALAEQIQQKTKIVTDFLVANGHDAASFDVNGLSEFPITTEDEEAYTARQELIGLTKELHDITVGPKEGLRYLAWDVSLYLRVHFTDERRSRLIALVSSPIVCE